MLDLDLLTLQLVKLIEKVISSHLKSDHQLIKFELERLDLVGVHVEGLVFDLGKEAVELELGSLVLSLYEQGHMIAEVYAFLLLVNSEFLEDVLDQEEQGPEVPIALEDGVEDAALKYPRHFLVEAEDHVVHVV